MVLLFYIKDIGSSVMFFGAFLAMLYVATNRFSFVLVGLLLFAAGALLVAGQVPHIHDRIEAWQHPFDPALFNATLAVTGEDEDSVKKRLRTGTVVTTDDRNWELRYTLSALRFNQSRAVAIDMESATVAAQGYRFRVPYGTLLCVSDKPLHGELKLPGQANAFYERAISQHLRIGIETLDILRDEGDGLHSRKLRSFDEPPLR